MRLLLVWPFYEEYLRRFYGNRPELARASFQSQLDALLDDNFGWPPALCRRLAQRGHEVGYCLTNVRPLAEAWHRETGVAFDERTWQLDMPLAMARQFDPDVVWLGTSTAHFGPWLARLSSQVRRVVAWVAAPIPAGTKLDGIDCILSSHRNFVDRFRGAGLRAERLLPAFEPSIIGAGPAPARDVPVSFVGSLSGEHATRIRFLEEISAVTPMQLWTPRPRLFSRALLRPADWRTHVRSLLLGRRSRGAVFGMEMYLVLRRSILTVNVHIGAAGGLAGNMRMFEATGCGAALMTEDAPNLRELFEPGTEVVPYSSAKQLGAEIRRLLADPSLAIDIGRRGQQATLDRHSTVERAAELEAILESVCAS